MKTILRSSLNVLLRTAMVTALAFASYPLVAAAKDFQYPLKCILAVFYFIVFMYFNIFNLWSAGCKDKIKYDSGHIKPMLYKGFAAGAIVYVPTVIIYVLTGIFSGTVRTVSVFITYILCGHGQYVYSVFNTTMIGSGTVGFIITLLLCIAGIAANGTSYVIGFKGIKIIQPWLDQWKKN